MAKKLSGLGATDRALKSVRTQIAAAKKKKADAKRLEIKKKALAKARLDLKRISKVAGVGAARKKRR